MADIATPMMRQYRRIKGEISSEIILFFRLGDFYEMFYEDARTAAPILNIALTERNKVPMCGVPFHSADNYIAKLVRSGRKVAICEQVEDADDARGIVRREVTRVITPGTVTEDNILESARHNFLAGISHAGNVFGLALLDLSTGLFQGQEIKTLDGLKGDLIRFSPSECIIPEVEAENMALRGAVEDAIGGNVSVCDDWPFEYETARDNLIRHFGVHSLEGFGGEGKIALVSAAGGILHYVREELRRHVAHIKSFRVRNTSDFLVLDESTCANLDLVPRRGRDESASLLKVLDVTSTAMGGRELREWILQPLSDLSGIRRRQEAVETFCKNRSLLLDLRNTLGDVRDLERLIARIGSGSGNARDVVAVGVSLACLPTIRAVVDSVKAGRITELAEAIVPLPELVGLIERSIVDEPPITLKEGGIIKPGYSAQLDELGNAATEGRQWLAEYQTREQIRTGIKNIKVRHNKVFGYYIEVSKGQLANVPSDYIRKQTLVNAERFITPELKEYENRITGAQEKAVALEYELFSEIRDRVTSETQRIQAAAAAIAELDVLASLADRAAVLRYVKPGITDSDHIHIKGGRHPVIEEIPDAERFVPNDTLLDCDENQLIIITGPNMAGKSTYIRQVALIVIMAQMGSFVPADSAEVGIVDRVFTRVGASDDLARGRSTFMVEMQETANILNNATSRSLIVLDEIGRGTSTFDGISIAWAVAEYLHNNPAAKAKTLFATHYHELTDLSITMRGVKNYNVLVREQNDKVAFLRKIVPGGSDKSYGIQVARLAGMPDDVVARAKEILSNLEEGELGESGQPKIARRRASKGKPDSSQMNLFDL
ncbi:MAG: DNA mismatch repair protein MutS [Lentisphaerae bacterium]|nr:DNA mismatch repair protein MutS [Lentisphaerota bacterium]